MSRYVDANGLKQTFCAECSHSIKCEDCDIEYHFEHHPTADVVEVVRCKDCIHQRYCQQYILHKGFTVERRDLKYCSCAERRKDELCHRRM